LHAELLGWVLEHERELCWTGKDQDEKKKAVGRVFGGANFGFVKYPALGYRQIASKNKRRGCGPARTPSPFLLFVYFLLAD